MTTSMRRRLEVTGVVQGVGFRPFVHRLARDTGLAGTVRNVADGVTIEIEGDERRLERFEQRLIADAPTLARIETIGRTDLAPRGVHGFRIESSAPDSASPVASIPPDTATCESCLAEMRDPRDRRHRHPFITCTDCGPRFTIITALPYDRRSTTMRDFARCRRCAQEYRDPADRRHHAQPIACHECGPTIAHWVDDRFTDGTDIVLARTHDDLAGGRIVAIKGLGGFHLAVDATCDEAVARLRGRKHRPDKPFAVMVPDVATARQIAHLDGTEVDALTGPARPVVLAERRTNSMLSRHVAPGNPLVGVMLPPTPLHHLLFDAVPNARSPVPVALVMTSGNVAGEPICYQDDDAFDRLGTIADSFVTHDRAIRVPCDDSVVRIVANSEMPVRRSRGHAPLPIRLPFTVAPTLAVGGEIKNTACLARGRHGWMSQHIGDMGCLASIEALEETAALLAQLTSVDAEVIAVDRHPGYHTRRWGHQIASGRPVIEVQHHHAHLAALLAEHGLDDEPVTGIVFDGTGYGDDGDLWGGEVLVGGYSSFDRWGHLAPVALPGGEIAIREPWRAAVAHLAAAGIDPVDDLPPLETASAVERTVIERQISDPGRSPRTTSMGRLFDVVASLIGIRHRISYEAQAAIELEHLAARTLGRVAVPPLQFPVDATGTIDPAPVVADIARDVRRGIDTSLIAASFHLAVVDLIVTLADRVRNEREVTAVGLTGGVFQNALLTSLAMSRLQQAGHRVLVHRTVPANDGGLALGQVAVAHHRSRS